MSTKMFFKVGLMASMVVLTLAPLSTVRAEDPAKPETMDVVASGVGMNETEATKDALGNAVRQAIGAIVGTDSLVQNEEIIRDQILTYSDGFVDKYEVVGKPTTALNGLTSVTIRARIVRSKLIQKAKAANISVLEVDGKGLFAEAVTKIEQKKSAAALIAEEFRDMPKKLIKAEVVSKPAYDDKTQKVSVSVRTCVDRVAYDALTKRLAKILDEMRIESFSIASSVADMTQQYMTQERYVQRIGLPESLFPRSFLEKVGGRQLSVIIMCENGNEMLTSSRWRVFLVEGSMMEAIGKMLAPVMVSVDMLSNSGEVLDGNYFAIGYKDHNEHLMGGPVTLNDIGFRTGGSVLFVYPSVTEAPVFVTWGITGFNLAGPLVLNSVVDFDMPPEKLKDISQIVCKVASAGVPAGQ